MPRFSRSGLVRRAQYHAARARNAAANFLVSGSVKGYRSQHPADFSEYVRRQGGRQVAGFPDKWRIDPQFDIADPSRIAVVIHCFYADLMPELFDRLRNLPIDFDLFVTNASGADVAVPEDLGRMRHSVGTSSRPSSSSTRESSIPTTSSSSSTRRRARGARSTPTSTAAARRGRTSSSPTWSDRARKSRRSSTPSPPTRRWGSSPRPTRSSARSSGAGTRGSSSSSCSASRCRSTRTSWSSPRVRCTGPALSSSRA